MLDFTLDSLMLQQSRHIRWPASQRPMLLTVIDTEEEFDWDRPVDRRSTGVNAMRSIGRIQSIFDSYGITPCYVVDYPVASRPEGSSPLREIYQSGRCEIGAHLHPWVNPPYDEPLTPRNTFPGNLSADLERAKLETLVRAIETAFGARPTIYKAGRYGVGPNTAAILEGLGFEVDLSICPPVDYRTSGGPDFRGFSPEPYWFGSELLEIPITGAFVGWARRAWRLYDVAVWRPLRGARLAGLLSRARAVDRLMLSPEGFTPEEHRRLTMSLLRGGVRTFTWSLHSPSTKPGCTPYVRNEADLRRFLDTFRRFFDFFFGELDGMATTPGQLKRQLETPRERTRHFAA
jgi:hypothetical protein